MSIDQDNIRIQTPAELSPFGTKVFAGGIKLNKVRSITFRQKAGRPPRLTIEAFAVDTIIEGTMEVERVALCPACKQRMTEKPQEVAAHDVTELNDEWERFVAGPKEPAD